MAVHGTSRTQKRGSRRNREGGKVVGGEAGTTLVRFPPNQKLPDGYEVMRSDGLYWWQNADGDCDGQVADRFAARRMAIRHYAAKLAKQT